MSERKSWDVQPKRRRTERPSQAASPERVPIDGVRRVARQAPIHRASTPRPARPSSERLRERRKRARKTGRTILAGFFLALIAAALYALWLPQLRINEVYAEGPSAEGVAKAAKESIEGTYAYILPRNSIFFFPKRAVRKAVLAKFPEVAALSIARSSFQSIALMATPRVRSFIWCGPDIDTNYPSGACFDTDAEGLIFKPSGTGETTVLTVGSSTPQAPGDLRIFAPLDRALVEGQSPTGAHVVHADSIPDALRFVKAIRGLGVPVSALALRGDEADLWLSGPTRITYVLGNEEEAAELAASTIPTLNLTNGSVQYLDLRFKGKAYVKRYGE